MADLHLLSPLGFRAGGVYAGIKTRHANDIGLLIAESNATAAAVFTTNRVFAAPVKVGRAHVKAGKLRGVVMNSGCANACTGKQGERDALEMCKLAAISAGGSAKDWLPSSTGIIGHLLPMEKVRGGIYQCSAVLGNSSEHALMFGEAIMTTDTRRKHAAVSFKVGKQVVTVAGVSKGAGMIGPRMSLAGPPGVKGGQATLLAYLTTDAKISAAALRKVLAGATDESFNALTIDDHCSTNDTCCMLASGMSHADTSRGAALASFTKAVNEVTRSLAYQVAADGEGATKVFRVVVKGAKTDAAARAMASRIANSPLVKCAIHGNDPNWGRIVSAAGMAGVPFDPDKSTLTLAGTKVYAKGTPVKFNADAVSKAMAAAEVTAELNCGSGKGSFIMYTCDFSKEYVTINADYHT